MTQARLGLATTALLVATLTAAGAFAQAAPPAAPQINAGWIGEIAAGGTLATGNTTRRAFDLDLRAAKREGGIENRYRLLGEVAWEAGLTTAQRVQANAQTNVDIRNRTYAFATAGLDDNRFSGYRYEVTAGLGLGYRLIDTQRTHLSVEAGPAYRIAKVRDTGEQKNTVFARFYSAFRHELSDTARLTNDLLVTVDHITTRIDNTVALTSKLIGNLSGRVSFNVRHDAEPLPGIKKTDTLTKLSLVYGF
jgi:putative salt-induced outer membrane protein